MEFLETIACRHAHAQDQRKLLCVHPHGIFATGWCILYAREELRGCRFCMSTVLYRSPFMRVLLHMTGYPAAADKATFQSLMRKRGPMAVLPGGFEEATITSDTAHRVYLKNRMGFIKYALQHGYSIVPACECRGCGSDGRRRFYLFGLLVCLCGSSLRSSYHC